MTVWDNQSSPVRILYNYNNFTENENENFEFTLYSASSTNVVSHRPAILVLLLYYIY